MPTILLNDVERWLLVSALRNPKRNGTGAGSGNDVDATAELLDALREREWVRRCRHAVAHAKTVLRAKARADARERGSSEDSPVGEPSEGDLARAADLATANLVNDLDPEDDPKPYRLSRDQVEDLNDEIERMHEKKEYPHFNATAWRGIRRKVAEAYAKRADPDGVAAPPDGGALGQPGDAAVGAGGEPPSSGRA